MGAAGAPPGGRSGSPAPLLRSTARHGRSRRRRARSRRGPAAGHRYRCCPTRRNTLRRRHDGATESGFRARRRAAAWHIPAACSAREPSSGCRGSDAAAIDRSRQDGRRSRPDPARRLRAPSAAASPPGEAPGPWPSRRAPGLPPRRIPRCPRLLSLLDERLRQPLAQREHAGSNPRLDGAERQLEPLGQLRLRQPEEVRLFDEHALIGRQRLESPRDGALLLAGAGLRLGILRRWRFRRRLHSSHAHAVGAQPIDRAVARDAHEPGRRRAERNVVGFSPGPDENEDLLEDLFRLAAIADDAEDQSEQQAAVPIVQRTDSRLVAGDNPIDQRDVSAGVFLVLHVSRRRVS